MPWGVKAFTGYLGESRTTWQVGRCVEEEEKVSCRKAKQTNLQVERPCLFVRSLIPSTRPSHQDYDATLLMEAKGPFPFKILVDQGEADDFLAEQLKPQDLEAACLKKGRR